MTVANLAALRQSNVVRLLALLGGSRWVRTVPFAMAASFDGERW
jgi:hypothetical protein